MTPTERDPTRFGSKALILLALTMIAFAGNSLIARLALRDDLIDPVGYTSLRLLSGALMLAAILLLRDQSRQMLKLNLTGSVSLFVYAIAFSIAYIALDAGLGALVMFGVVQLTMFAMAIFKGQSPAPTEWIGMLLAFAGLVWLLAPGSTDLPLPMVAMMTIAGVGWAVYTLDGRRAGDPVINIAQTFLAASILILPFLIFWPNQNWSIEGALLAITSGAITSGLGYVMWYSVLPLLTRTRAAVVQLLVPPLTLLLSVSFMGEELTMRLLLASAVIIFGIGLAVTTPKNRAR